MGREVDKLVQPVVFVLACWFQQRKMQRRWSGMYLKNEKRMFSILLTLRYGAVSITRTDK